MGIASETKRLTRDIITSSKTRTRRIGQIKRETKESREQARGMVKDFQASREEAGTGMRRELAQNRANRKSEVIKMRSDFRQDQKEVRNEMREAAACWQKLKSTKIKQRKEV